MLTINKQSGIYRLENTQILRGNLKDIWDFFSRPENLNKMTPDSMPFEITSKDLPTYTYQGQIITYHITIFPYIKSNWVTEITLVENEHLFIDEQRYGPYSMWHHEHHFEQISPQEVKMTDLISYKLPLGELGNLVAGDLIIAKLKEIFTFRNEYCDRVFGR